MENPEILTLADVADLLGTSISVDDNLHDWSTWTDIEAVELFED